MTNKTFTPKQIRFIAYLAFAIVTFIGSVALLIWSILGEIDFPIEVKKATLQFEGDIRREYLVGQDFESDGLKLNIGTDKSPKLIEMDKCSITADFSQAGEKTVEVSYMATEHLNYVATLPVNVLFVRSLQVETYPSLVTVEGGNASFSDDFKAYAVLSQKPQTDAFGEVQTTADGGYRIALTKNDYEVATKTDPTLTGYYSVDILCGSVSYPFNVYNAAGKSFVVDSLRNIVTYTAENAEEGATLSLIVTDKSASYQETCTGVTSGYYVYQKGSEQMLLPFGYELKDKEEVLKSQLQTTGLVESATSDKYVVSYDNNTFNVDAFIFQNAVVGGMIVEDSGYKLVVNSTERILSFDYDPADPTDATDPAYDATATESPTIPAGNLPKLTLYITDYDMNPLLGTGNGWSKGVYIFVDSDGTARKIPFFMQAWVWTYVPLSEGKGDVYADAMVSDYIYNHEAPAENQYNSYYRGSLYTTVKFYDRMNGFKTVRFSVDDKEVGGNIISAEDRWLPAIMGM